MAKWEKSPPISLPPCTGCSKCGDFSPLSDKLYALGYDNKWYCSACFRKIAVRWPSPQTQQEKWVQDPTAFKERWSRGESYTEIVRKRLIADGLHVEAQERTFRKNFKERVRYRDEVDLMVNGHRIEVKSRRHFWTTLDDFPFPSIFVDTVQKWDGHRVRPLATINISQQTGAMIVVPGKSQWAWTTVEGVDKDSGFQCMFYSAPKSVWTTYEALVQYLRGEHGKDGKDVQDVRGDDHVQDRDGQGQRLQADRGEGSQGVA